MNGRVLAVGGERFLVWLLSTDDDGDALEWCVSHEDSEEAVAERLKQIQENHQPSFASAYRIERVVVAEPGERKPLVCAGPPLVVDPAPEATQTPVQDGEVLF